MVTVIDEQDIEYSTTLTEDDIGKYAVVYNGCFHLRDSLDDAVELFKLLRK